MADSLATAAAVATETAAMEADAPVVSGRPLRKSVGGEADACLRFNACAHLVARFEELRERLRWAVQLHLLLEDSHTQREVSFICVDGRGKRKMGSRTDPQLYEQLPSMLCGTCRGSGGYACLSCNFVGCSHGRARHAFEHFAATGHGFGTASLI